MKELEKIKRLITSEIKQPLALEIANKINEIVDLVNLMVDGKEVVIKSDKKKYGEFNNVLLSDDEYKKAKEKYKELLPAMIEKLSIAIKSNGYKYKSHYATFSSWVYKSILEDKSNIDSNIIKRDL